jgi:hypothetical protein
MTDVERDRLLRGRRVDPPRADPVRQQLLGVGVWRLAVDRSEWR